MSLTRTALDPIGQEITGIDLGDLSDAEFAQLHDAVLHHGLVVVRDQRLTPEQQVALGHRFGPIEGQEYALGSVHPEVIVIGNVDAEGRVVPRDEMMMRLIQVNEQWHTDSSFREVPASISIFAAVVVPPAGGDTLYASLRSAWLGLTPERQAELRPLRAIHDYAEAYRRTGGSGLPAAISDGITPKSHPLVRVHPETGEECLFVSGHVYGIEGWEPERGRAFAQELIAECTRPEHVYRHRWREGDVLLWDNRSMLHRAEGFSDEHARVMHHVRVAGDGPVIAASGGASGA